MKLNETSQVYINCRTQEEREMTIDILYSLNCRWNGGDRLDRVAFYDAPMHIEFNKQRIRRGSGLIIAGETPRYYSVIEAKDLRNQWISLKRRQK